MDKLERRIGLGTGCIIVFFFLFLIFRRDPFPSNEVYVIARILLSLGVGIVAGTIPGFLNVRMDTTGLFIRAGGGMAAFLLTFFFSPGSTPSLTPPPKGQAEVYPVLLADFRTVGLPSQSNEDRRNAPLVITVPVSVRNVVQPSASTVIDRTEISIQIDGNNYKFPWLRFVKMHEENYGKWLGIEGDAAPFSLRQGDVKSLQILHGPSSTPLKWGQFFDFIDTKRPQDLQVNLSVFSEGRVFNQTCTGNFSDRYSEIDLIKSKTKNVIGRITVECKQS